MIVVFLTFWRILKRSLLEKVLSQEVHTCNCSLALAMAFCCELSAHARILKVLQRGPNLTTLFSFFLLKRDDAYHYKRAIIGPPSKRHLNGVRWRADDGPTLNAGLAAL